MNFPSSGAARAPGSTDAATPATVAALELECTALRAEIAQLRAHLAVAEEAARRAPPEQGGADDIRQTTLREYQAVFETAGVGMVVMHYRTMRRCNRAMERMFGYPPGALDEQSIELLHGNDERWAQVGENIRATMRRGEVYEDECELNRRDGSLLWVRRAGCALAGNEPLLGTVWVYEDITAQRNAESEMRRARQLAEQATRMKSEFLANMRHEIRTPMNNILGLAQLALLSGLAPQQQEQMRGIRASAQHLFGMLSDILDLSAIEAGKLRLHAQAFSPRALVQDVALQNRDAATAKGLALRSEVADDLPGAMLGDVAQLRRILSLFVHNAIKFTLQGEICIRASLRAGDARSADLRLEVQDTGVGIGPDEQARLFEPFVQADTSATRRHSGTGLGLSLCNALARMMGGTVGVDSQVGQGSVFWCTLRLPIADAVTAAPATPRDVDAQEVEDGEVLASMPTLLTATQLDAFDALLNEGDPDAVAWLSHHAWGLRALLGPEFQAFAARVHAFDFDVARHQLRALSNGSATLAQATAST